MSLKIKLSMIFSLIVTLILLINNYLHFFSTREQLRADLEKQMEMIAREIAIAIEHSQYGSQYVEDLIGQALRTASVAAQNALDKDAKNVTNEQLVELSKKIGVSHITLFQQQGDDIVGVKSSDPKEIGIGTKSWDFWFSAFKQLLENKNVTIPQGQTLPNYWSGPMGISTSDPNYVDKWGYYFDGTTNYIIDPYLRDEYIKKFEQYTGPTAIVSKTLKNNDALLEITGFNPKAFGKETITTNHNGTEFVELFNRPVLFGEYSYKDETRDIQSVQRAANSGALVSFDEVVNGKRVIKSFIPVKGNVPYVIGLVTDYKLIQNILNQQLLVNVMISLVLLIVVFLLSYFLSGYIVRPVLHILHEVNQISQGQFGVRLNIDRKDELGILALGVNKMSESLDIYTKELHEQRAQMQYQAYHDALTGLPNRLMLNEQLCLQLAQVEDQPIGIMFLDLDRFKNINDTLGHSIGDILLKEVVDRIKRCLRPGDTLYRLSGDEFILVLTDLSGEEQAQSIAKKIIEILSPSFNLNGRELFITISIGISISPTGGTDIDTLVKNADTAMYSSKEQGGNHYHLYTLSMNNVVNEKLELENNLRKALKKDQFELYYQPKVTLQTGQITGVEALLRWNHPKLGIIPPAKFIPLAEETGIILSIGEWVLRTACKQNKEWQDQGYAPIRVAVNLSISQFREDNMVDTIASALEETRLEAKYLEIEITESISMHKLDQVRKKLLELKNLGVHISIDDFGTGYSSLNYLNKFPIDTLKIDQTFVNNLYGNEDEPGQQDVVTAIIALAHNLNINVVAEGVETVDQLNFLRSHQCDDMQGYYFSKPLSAVDIELLFNKI